MKDGARERPIEKYGKKEQKDWLDNTLPDPHPCTAGIKEEEHTSCKILLSILFTQQFLFVFPLEQVKNCCITDF